MKILKLVFIEQKKRRDRINAADSPKKLFGLGVFCFLIGLTPITKSVIAQEVAQGAVVQGDVVIEEIKKTDKEEAEVIQGTVTEITSGDGTIIEGTAIIKPIEEQPTVVPVADNPTTNQALHVDTSINRPWPDFSNPIVQQQWEGFIGFGTVPVVEPVTPPPVSQAWETVPGVYQDNSFQQALTELGADSAGILLLSKAHEDMKSFRQVEPDLGRFMHQVATDKQLKADFMAFVVGAAYHYLTKPSPGNAATQFLQKEIGVRSMDWQAYSAEQIRYQWDVFSNNKMRTGKYQKVGPDKYKANTLSALIDVPSGCGDFEPEPPLISTRAGKKGQEAVELIYGNLQFFETIKKYSEVQLDEGIPWSETLLGGFESTWGMSLERSMNQIAAKQAFIKMGIGTASSLPLVALATGLKVNNKYRTAKLTEEANKAIKEKDFGDEGIRRLYESQFRDQNAGLADRLAKEFNDTHTLEKFNGDWDLFRKAEKEFIDDRTKATLEKQAKFIEDKILKKKADDAAAKAAEKIAKKSNNAADDLMRRLAGEIGEQSAEKIASKVGQKVGTKLGTKAFSAALGIIGVIWDFGEILAAALPCEVWEEQILARLQVVEPDFYQTLVASREYDTGLVYETCRDGFSGTGTLCIKDGCPYGYTESLHYCTAKVIPKESHTRKAGIGGTCLAGEENSAGLCYSACPPGLTGVGPVCWSSCPAGYNDTGAFCTKPAHVINQDNYSRATQSTPLTCAPHQEYAAGLCYTKCKPGFEGSVTQCIKTGCPPDYDNDNGLSCYRWWPPSTYWKPTYDRGVGVAVNSCPPGKERKGALCYPVCKPGYRSTALECDKPCPSGYIDDGVTCRSDVHTIAKTSATRNISIPLQCDNDNFPEKDGLLCYPKCKEGYFGIGPVCWKPCPEGLKDNGALCRYVPDSGVVSIKKEQYDRGTGRAPRHVGGDYDGDGLIDSADPDSYNRVDNLVDSVTAETRIGFRKETFLHLVKFLITEPADAGQLVLPELK